MIIRIDSWDFKKAFEDYNRGNYFSNDALDTLFEYYEDIDTNMELDVIAICCDWTEYTMEDLALETNYGYMYTIDEYMDDMRIDAWEEVDIDDYYKELLERVQYSNSVIYVNDDCVLVGA